MFVTPDVCFAVVVYLSIFAEMHRLTLNDLLLHITSLGFEAFQPKGSIFFVG